MDVDNREPAASTSSTDPAEAWSPDATKTTPPTYALPKIVHAATCHAAVRHRSAAIG
jgi:hypothetical protein